MNRVIASELLKLRTTKAWLFLLIATVVMTALAFTGNAIEAHYTLDLQPTTELPPDVPPEQAAEIQREQQRVYNETHSALGLAKIAAGLYTSGQFFGGLFALILGVLIVTNEFFHQTATATFLTTPRRTVVIVAKLITVMIMGALFWLVTTVLNVIGGAIFYAVEDLPNSIGQWDVTRSVLLNLAVFMIWSIFGLALGVLIRSQIGAVITSTVLYLLGLPFAFLLFGVIREFVVKEDWVLTSMVVAPAVATLVMTTPGRAFEHAPEQWVGAVVLIGYAVLAGVAGTLITRRRDIS